MEEKEVIRLRAEFPILGRKVAGKDIIYLDNAATSQAPQRVVKTIEDVYFNTRANVHRGVHTLSQEMTAIQEQSRERIREFINAEGIEEIIFTKGTTESINLVASSFGSRFKPGDEIILTEMEHHANIVPWQLLRERTGIVIRVVPINEKGELVMEEFEGMFNPKTVFVSVCHVSNVLGTVNPVKEIIEISHKHGIPVLIDGAQGVPHLKVDVKELDCDFYVFSAHKMYGPSGVGVLYGKQELLKEMPPYQGGGAMIEKVTFEKTTFADLPFKFEAGTPDYTGIAAFASAIDFMEEIGVDRIREHEEELLKYCTSRMNEIDGLSIYGTSDHKSGVISFLADGIHPYDLGMLLDKQGVEVRTGHHCAMPLMDRFDIPGTVRVSFAVYNLRDEVDRFISALRRSLEILR